MTKHPKPEVNETVIKTTCKLLDKSDVAEMIKNTFSKEDMIIALTTIWNLRNFTTNDRIEKYIHNKIYKKDNDGQN